MSQGQERIQGSGPDEPGEYHGSSDGRPDDAGMPDGSVYEWFRRGSELLDQGNAAAAVQLLVRAAGAEPDSRSIRETLARAQFDARSYVAALDSFRQVALADPSDDYAQFGWGLAAARMGDFESSAVHLALAVAMRPQMAHYQAALRQTRATLAARAGAFGPLHPDLRERFPGRDGSEAEPSIDPPGGTTNHSASGEEERE